jgi:hypothetical protein
MRKLLMSPNIHSFCVLLVVGVLYFAVVGLSYAQDGAHINTQSGQISVPIQSWKTLRDSRIVKQELDYSCGAASLATLLNEFYGQSVTEEALLKAMDNGNMRASFEDMQRALLQFGFRAIGYATSYEQLIELKMPVVAYLEYRKDDHFSVLRGINDTTVWLADPSLGNRTYSRVQFLEMWETRGINQSNSDLKGKILAILPNKEGITAHDGFFTKIPKRQTAQAVLLLASRHLP